MEEELLTFWFQTMRPYWFGCPVSIDELVTTKYNTILDASLEPTNINLPNHILAHIILHDQLSRHIYRGNKEQIALHDVKARELFALIKDSVDDFLNPEHRCFALMPSRHTFDKKELEWCLHKVTEWRLLDDVQIYRRFYQATVKALVNINNTYDLQYCSAFNPNLNNIDILSTILDPNSPRLNEKDKYNKELLELNIVKQFKQCLDNYIKAIKEGEKYVVGEPPVFKEITVSVSGGVDSMVALYLANCLYGEDYDVKAISINYANRAEQELEIDMVNRFCSLYRISHYVRTISEIKRTRDADREFYEQITRDIRFDAYKGISDYPNTNGIMPVILGHNLDDCLENVFSNIKKQKNYNNLFGMKEVSIERSVRILRPLLNISKAEIIEFANQFNIPYTYDSTPDWSERGKLRDQLIPSIKTFDPSLITGIVSMVNEFKGIYSVYKHSIPKIYYFETNCFIPMNEPVCILDYWKKIFTKIALHYKIDFVKNKSIKHFISVLQKKRTINNANNRITIAKQMVAQIDPGCVNIYITL